MTNIKVKFKEAYQDFGAYALLKNVTDKGVLIVDGTEVLNSIADLPTTNTVDGQEKAVIVQNGQVVTTSINNIGGESGGDFIPLSGTISGNSISGDIFIDSFSYDLGLKQGFEDYLSTITFRQNEGVFISSTNNNTGNSSNINVAENSVYINSLSTYLIINENDVQIGLGASGRGMTSITDFSPNITDLDYTQKIYVDTHIAFIPIPTSSTDPGIKGQMAVDAIYLYICVDTDTWTRVALAW